jgi:acetyl esterase/lipase
MAELQQGRVTVEYDVVFGTGGGRDLRCNVYHPPQPGDRRPAVMLVHGGGWTTGDRSQLHGYGILLGREGYVCVAPEYRLAGEAKWPAQIEDAKACLRWMRANAERLGIDPEKIAVEGNSAGGHLALMVAGTPNVAEFEGSGGNAGVLTHVAACMAFYAPTLLYSAESAQGQRAKELYTLLFGREAGPDVPRRASPLEYAKAGFPPTMLLTGSKDELVPHESSLRMHRALEQAQVPVELHVFEGAPHAFDAVPDYGRVCARIMLLFLDRHVANPRPIVVPTREAAARA